MPISNELMYAILAMDSYNRGYGEGISGLGGTGSKIGTASFFKESEVIEDTPGVNAGFYAAAYSYNNETVISYRGTDDFSSLTLANDIVRGWITGAGAYQTDQVRMATEFYQSITETENSDPRTGNATLTGHSLGGGLAGFVASLYGNKAIVYDNMPFELSSNNAQDAANPDTLFGIVARQYAQDTFYNGSEEVWDIDRSNITVVRVTELCG